MANQTTIRSQVGVSSVILKTPYQSGFTKSIDEPETENTIRIAIASQLDSIPHFAFNLSKKFFTRLQKWEINHDHPPELMNNLTVTKSHK